MGERAAEESEGGKNNKWKSGLNKLQQSRDHSGQVGECGLMWEHVGCGKHREKIGNYFLGQDNGRITYIFLYL